MFTSSSLAATLSARRSEYDQARGKLAGLQETAAKKQADLTQADHNLDVWSKARALLARVSEFAREQSLHQIEQLVTAILQAVIDDEINEFKIELKTEKDGTVKAEWRILKHTSAGVTVCNPENTDDGSVLDLIYLALDLAIAVIIKAGDIWLDEPVKQGFSPRYSANLATFLRGYAAKTGRRIVLITHSEDLAAGGDMVYRVTQEDGKSEVHAA